MQNHSESPTGPQKAELHNLWRTILIRLALLYFVPLLLLALFFNYQLALTTRASEEIHLAAQASRQAATLDLFLTERLINLSNVFDDPAFPAEPTNEQLTAVLNRLRRSNKVFVELGYLGNEGRLRAYTGNIQKLGTQNYSGEGWFRALRNGDESHVITDIYRGFREQPHFTIAVRREGQDRLEVLRAVLSPELIFAELLSRDYDGGLDEALVNVDGIYQVVKPEISDPLKQSSFRPPAEPRTGIAQRRGSKRSVYGYSWLNTAPWAVVVYGGQLRSGMGPIPWLNPTVLIITFIILGIGVVAIWGQARTSVRNIWKARETQRKLSGQLVQAAKLASVGELAAGIAHEINNPLAVVAEEVGLLKDLLDPELGGNIEDEDLVEHLDIMQAAVFRGRDITRKLLGFVRKAEVCVSEHDIHDILDEVADGYLGHELELANVSIQRNYDASTTKLMTDRNQLEQVLLNIMKNAVDAMGGNGTLTLSTSSEQGIIKISIADTGCGMSREQMERIFQPFYTTKEPGKGTGLGLSVSQGIVESLDGAMYVDSIPGRGSTFTIELPFEQTTLGECET